jgi:hypothetical protein
MEMTSPVNARLQTLNRQKMTQIVHVSRLRKYLEPSKPTDEPEIDGSDEFDWDKEVEQMKGVTGQPTNPSRDNKENTGEELDDLVEERELEVQQVVGIRRNEGATEYKIRWKGYSADADTWEPKGNLNCDRLIKEFHSREGTKCNQCEFLASSQKGIKSHMKKNHKSK